MVRERSSRAVGKVHSSPAGSLASSRSSASEAAARTAARARVAPLPRRCLPPRCAADVLPISLPGGVRWFCDRAAGREQPRLAVRCVASRAGNHDRSVPANSRARARESATATLEERPDHARARREGIRAAAPSFPQAAKRRSARSQFELFNRARGSQGRSPLSADARCSARAARPRGRAGTPRTFS